MLDLLILLPVVCRLGYYSASHCYNESPETALLHTETRNKVFVAYSFEVRFGSPEGLITVSITMKKLHARCGEKSQVQIGSQRLEEEPSCSFYNNPF